MLCRKIGFSTGVVGVNDNNSCPDIDRRGQTSFFVNFEEMAIRFKFGGKRECALNSWLEVVHSKNKKRQKEIKGGRRRKETNKSEHQKKKKMKEKEKEKEK